MAATVAAIASLLGTAVTAGTALSSGGGTAKTTSIDAAQLAQARQDAINAQIRAAYTTKLGQAGYSDSQGNGYSYDPATNSWVSKLGPQATDVQNAADQASISRNTTDLRQAQGANARADMNASRAQPLIDAAQRRLANFQPTSGSELGALLGETAANANTAAYRPIIQDTLRTFARSGTAAGPVLADLGRRSSADLRQGLIDARVKGMTDAGTINNQNRQGLQTDLTTAQAAGTPQFQYPGIVPSTNSKDMLTALQNRATGAAYSSALGNPAIAAANKESGDASDTLAKSIPATDPSITNNLFAGKAITDYLSSGSFKDLYGRIANLGNNNKTPSPTDFTGFGDDQIAASQRS